MENLANFLKHFDIPSILYYWGNHDEWNTEYKKANKFENRRLKLNRGETPMSKFRVIIDIEDNFIKGSDLARYVKYGLKKCFFKNLNIVDIETLELTPMPKQIITEGEFNTQQQEKRCIQQTNW